MKADYYLNAIGGTKMYSDSAFKEENIKLRFVKTRESLIYQQFKNAFVANLSIIDVMMFNSQAEIKVLLSQYDLIEGEN
ncbi:MAG: WbqC family protein [Eubacteriaceae bacterium]